MKHQPLQVGAVHLQPQTRKKLIFEIRRKIIHIVLGGVIAFLIYYRLFFLPLWLIILSLVLLIVYFLEEGKKIPLINNLVVSLERSKEKRKWRLRGALLFLVACILSYIIFNRVIATAAILTLVIGDTATAIYGICFGKMKSPINSKKHVDATLFGIAINTILIYLLLPIPFWPLFFASVIALFAEGFLPFEKIEKGVLGTIFDDNILVPLIAGLVLFFIV